ncbi:MAG: sugar O-acetyltransferase [Acutalibacteraceae bacterium]|nr:sugar O-acetyltransferase [Acutalibacteraceae bacterium]
MTEKEKMLAGMLYNSMADKSLVDDRQNAKRLCREYNTADPLNEEKRREIMLSILGSTKENFWIEQPFLCDYGYNIEIGENFYANYNLIVLDCAKVTIGDNAFIAPNVGIYTAGHPLTAEQRNCGLEYAYPITIGNNVWIGAGVHICPGVTIGDNAVIGAGSVVVKDIPPHALACGVPCKVVRYITEDDNIPDEFC